MIFKVKPAFETWPEADRTLWRALVAQGGPLDDAGALSHLRPTTLRQLMTGYAYWLRWLAESAPEALDLAPPDRVTAARLDAWMRALAALAPSTRLIFAADVLRVATAAAPERDWSAERRLRRLLAHAAAADNGGRKTGRIVDSGDLFEAGRALAATPLDGSDPRPALRVLDGAMIATLALMPMRLRAFAALALDRSVIVEPARIHVLLDADLMKTDAPWFAPVPALLDPILRRWIEAARPVLLTRDGRDGGRDDRLWIGKHGRGFAHNALRQRVNNATRAALGVPVPPHFFRDAAATTLARTSPEAARLTRALLGHSSYRTAERHYNHARSIEAGRDWAAVLDRLMAEEDEG